MQRIHEALDRLRQELILQAEPPERSFLKGNDVYRSYDLATVAIAQAPYEGTASYGKGTSAAPAAIIRASEFLEMYDIALDREPSELGIATLPPLPTNGGPQEMIARVRDQISSLLRDHRRPALLGGEHSVTLGAVTAAREAYPELGLVQFDAHADLRDSYEGTPLSHACVMRRVSELDIPCVRIGIRSMSKPEALFARDRQLVFHPGTPDAALTDAIDRLPARVYVTVDIDVLDPACMPATGTPEPGGMSWRELLDALRVITDRGKEVVACDLVEFAPIPGLHFCDYTAACLLYRMIGMFWGDSPKPA